MAMNLEEATSSRASPIQKAVRFGSQASSVVASRYQQETTVNETTGDRELDYRLLVQQLSDPDIKPSSLLCWLKELRQCTSMLDNELVAVSLRIQWADKEEPVARAYQEFLTHLVSAQTVLLRQVLYMLVGNFLPKVSVSPRPPAPEETTEDRDTISRATDQRIFDNCHAALASIAAVAPVTANILVSVLAGSFPFMKKEVYQQECYVKNVLRVAGYMPKLRPQILELVVDKLLKIDVHAPREEIEELSRDEADSDDDSDDDDDKSMDEEVTQFHIDLSGGQADFEESETTTTRHEMGARLDSCMLVLLDTVRAWCHHDNVSLHLEEAKSVWRQLLGVFNRLVLPTHASSHVQFVVFYAASFHPSFADALLDFLWKKVVDPSTPVVLRQTAAAYMGGLVARAKFVSAVTARTCLDLMVGWAQSYVDRTESSSLPACPDLALHATFYSVCQAVFYLFVFRHRQLLELPRGRQWARGLNFERLVMSQLNPLKVCLETVVKMFASVCRLHQVVFCYTVLERNRRQTLPQVHFAQNHRLLPAVQGLDSFFPFDPYLLPQSGRPIKPLYQQWEGSVPNEVEALYQAEKRRSGATAEPEEDDFLKSGAAASTSYTERMSVSPGFIYSVS